MLLTSMVLSLSIPLSLKAMKKYPQVKILKMYYFLFIDFRERQEGERERTADLLFHLFMHSLLAAECPGWGSKPQPW